MSERVQCVCGSWITAHGQKNHERGLGHRVMITRKALEARGLSPLPHPYGSWVADGPGTVYDYSHYDRGGIKRKGRGAVCAWYAPKAITEVVLHFDLPRPARRRFVDRWKAHDPRIEAGMTAYALSGDVNALFSCLD